MKRKEEYIRAHELLSQACPFVGRSLSLFKAGGATQTLLSQLESAYLELIAVREVVDSVLDYENQTLPRNDPGA